MHNADGMFSCEQYRFSENNRQEWISFLENELIFQS